MLVSFNLVETILSEGIIFLVFVLTCVRLAGKRFAQKKIRIIYGMLMAFFIFLYSIVAYTVAAFAISSGSSQSLFALRRRLFPNVGYMVGRFSGCFFAENAL